MRVNNPVFPVDMPDPDLLRVGDTYYMVSTTMFYMPGAPILKSKDLCHWEIVSYVFDTIEDNEIYRLENGRHAYGKGQWATSLLHDQGKFYACFVCHDLGKTYIYSTADLEKGPWERAEIGEVFHDMSFLIWQGTPYLVYGNGDIYIVELEKDMSGVKEGGLRRLLLHTPTEGLRLRCEGCRAYVKDERIYLLFIDWPVDAGRREVCYRSCGLEGPWERKTLMQDDCGRPMCGVAQGALIDSEAGDWYAMMFQDRGASGRIPFLMRAGWEDGWPVLGVDTPEGRRIPMEFETPFFPYEAAPLAVSDSFCHGENRLGLTWQWNHNPDNSLWSFTVRPGWLCLRTGRTSTGLMDARNTLTQRTPEPGCVCEVTLDTAGLREGDYAGLCAFQGRYGQIGAAVCEGKRYALSIRREEGGTLVKTAEPLEGSLVYLRVVFDYRSQADRADFYYSTDGKEWKKLGETLDMVFTLDVFVGYRIGLFCYSVNEAGGFADFKDFRLKELQGAE